MRHVVLDAYLGDEELAELFLGLFCKRALSFWDSFAKRKSII